MKGIYLLPFPISGESGKNRASRQKAAALSEKVDELIVYAPASEGSLFVRGVQIFVNELKVAWLIVSQRAELNFLITRGLAGVMSVFLARMRNVHTFREVHSIASQEASYIRGGNAKKAVAKMVAHLDHWITLSSEVRIFNHPNLLSYFEKKGWKKDGDIYCYNGGAPEEAVSIGKEEAREYFGLPKNKRILVFVGSASLWHGVDYLVDLQHELNNKYKDIIIVCGGGDIALLDPGGVLLNISPLDGNDASKLVRASDACLLPVKNIRISPGSPLKLYDYILNYRPIITQKGVLGYEDEVFNLQVGTSVDFEDPCSAAKSIVEFIDSEFEMPDIKRLEAAVSWSSRMECWLKALRNS